MRVRPPIYILPVLLLGALLLDRFDTEHQLRALRDDPNAQLGKASVIASSSDESTDAFAPESSAVMARELPDDGATQLHMTVDDPDLDPELAEIHFDLARPGFTRLVVLDPQGNRVRTLAARVLNQGPHDRVWDGRAEDGSRMPDGLYFARLESRGKVSSVRMVLE